MSPLLSDPAVVAPRALALVERVGGRRLLSELVDLYAAHAPTRLAEARVALAAGNTDGVRRACHALKSGSAQLGAMRVADGCAELEARAAAGTIADATVRLDAIATALDVALAALRARIAYAEEAA